MATALTSSVESANASAESQLRRANRYDSASRPRKGGLAGKLKKKPILIITVDIGAGKSGDINVFEGDANEDLARAFCALHGLNDALVPAIAKHIQSNVEALQRRAQDAADEADARAKTKNEEHRPQSQADDASQSR